MHRRNHKSGNGVVIGNLIMIMASVAMASVLMYWSLSFQSGAQASYSTAIYQSNAQASEQISIDDVYFISSPKSMTVYVRNFGDTPVMIKQVYVDGTSHTTTETTIVARTYGGVSVQYSSWLSTETHVIRVATALGSQYERSFKVP